jgi:drug/metabolite transporter (DMT)-like permease
MQIGTFAVLCVAAAVQGGVTLDGLVPFLLAGAIAPGLSNLFITGLYVVFTPLLALVAFHTPVPAAVWVGVVLSLAGLLLLSGAPGGSWAGNALVLGNAVAQSLQIVAMERFAPRYDPRALTFLQMAVSCAGFAVIALLAGQAEWPDDGKTWYALVVTGVFAGRSATSSRPGCSPAPRPRGPPSSSRSRRRSPPCWACSSSPSASAGRAGRGAP